MSTYKQLSSPWIAAGWQDVLPLPIASKFPPPAGYTGKEARGVSDLDRSRWADLRGNAALRVPENVIALDVDAYKDSGLSSLAELQAELGKLPATWRISSRDDGLSGIYLFRNVSRAKLAGEAGKGIEIVQRHHRYAVLPGSVHPNGGVYKLFAPGGPVTSGIPTVRQLPRLPRKWIARLAAKTSEKSTTRTLPAGWKPKPLTGDRLPIAMENAVRRFQARCESGGSRYQAALAATYNVARLASEGVPGASETLAVLEEAYVSAVVYERGEAAARREFRRMTAGLKV